MNIILGIDQSKRSTALVAIEANSGRLIDATLISVPKTIDNEDLLLEQWDQASRFIYAVHPQFIVIEGLAYDASGSSRDLIWGLQWLFRTLVLAETEIRVGVIPVTSWRSKILTREDQALYKAKYGSKGLKIGVYEKLPLDAKNMFDSLVEEKRDSILLAKGLVPSGRSNAYKEAVYDLADAWGVANYRRLLYLGTIKPPKPVDKTKKSKLKRRFPSAQ